MAELSITIGQTTGTKSGTDANVSTIIKNFLRVQNPDVEIDSFTPQQLADKTIAMLVGFLVESHDAYLRDAAAETAAGDAVENAENWE